MNKIKYITFATDGYYKEIMEKYLLPSLDRFQLSYNLYYRPNKHNWFINGKYKTEVILNALKKFPNNDIVFLDADAKIIKYPELFETIPSDYNISVHFLDWNKFWHHKEGQSKREVLGGTIYLHNNESTIKFVREWNKLNQESTEWGQKILQRLLEQNKIKYFNLPFEYCRILKRYEKIPVDAIIVQYQASREGKNQR